MLKFSLLLGLGIALSACSSSYEIGDRTDFVMEQTRIYRGETRERMLDAADAVVRSSGTGEYEFVYGLNGFSARKHYFIYGGIGSAFGRQKWDFNTEPAPGGIRGAITISDAGDVHGGFGIAHYEDVKTSAARYRLFWARVDYMLGRRPDWVGCGEARQVAAADGAKVDEAVYGLCGPQGGAVPAPLPRGRAASR